jgi:hypothetical protein
MNDVAMWRFGRQALKKIPLCLVCAALLAAGAPAGALDFAEVGTRHFTVFFGERLAPNDVRLLTESLESAYAAVAGRLGFGAARPIDVVVFEKTGDFTAETGLPFWSASAMADGRIYLQPVRVLKERGVLESTIGHEVCLALLYEGYGTSLPRWLSEGLAVYFTGEIVTIKQELSGKRPRIEGPDGIDALLLDRTDRERNRWGYVLAWEEAVKTLEGRGAAAKLRGKLP